MRQARKDFLKEIHIAEPSEAVKIKLFNMFLPALGPYGLTYRYSDIEDFSKQCADSKGV